MFFVVAWRSCEQYKADETPSLKKIWGIKLVRYIIGSDTIGLKEAKELFESGLPDGYGDCILNVRLNMEQYRNLVCAVSYSSLSRYPVEVEYSLKPVKVEEADCMYHYSHR